MKRSKPILAGNWKMNKSSQEVHDFFSDFLSRFSSQKDQAHFIFFPSTLHLSLAGEILKSSAISWGGQGCYFQEEGAFTGEISPKALKDIGASFCLVGHSERRKLFGETDEDVALKASLLQKWNITPLICLGETLEQREKGETEVVIKNQLRKALGTLDKKREAWIAYEPVWAIGTGRAAEPAQVKEVHKRIRKELELLWDSERAENTPLLYGGSVKPESSAELIAQPHVDGFLVGSASLDSEVFAKIFQNSVLN